MGVGQSEGAKIVLTESQVPFTEAIHAAVLFRCGVDRDEAVDQQPWGEER